MEFGTHGRNARVWEAAAGSGQHGYEAFDDRDADGGDSTHDDAIGSAGGEEGGVSLRSGDEAVEAGVGGIRAASEAVCGGGGVLQIAPGFSRGDVGDLRSGS